MLARLGLGEVRVSTFSEWARRELGRLVPDFDRPVLEDAPPLVARLKRHRALLEALPRWLARHRPQSRVGIETLRFEICTDRDLLGEVVAAAGGELPRGAVEETARRTARQAEPRSEAAHAGTDRARLRAVDGASLDAGTPEEIRQTVDEEDLALLLEIWRLTRGPGARRRAHLVLDEAQELAAIELRALRQTQGEPPSVTVAGDDLQQTDPGAGFEGWDRTLEEIGAPDAARRELEVGYRCPLPIATLAQEILGPLARPGGAPSGRPGAPVGWHRFPSVGAAALFLQDALSDLLDREPNASVAVLTRDAEAARRWAGHLGTLPRLRWVRTGDFSFTPGIDVCEVALAKGLEFDYVVLPDAEASVYPTTDESRRLLHVAATRAMHQLWVCSIGTPSLVLPAQGGGPSPDHRPDE
jgi:DNA helicase IV